MNITSKMVVDRLPVDADIIVADILNLSTEEPAKESEALGNEREGNRQRKISYLAKRFLNAKTPRNGPEKKILAIARIKKEN